MEWREKKERNRIKVLFLVTWLHLIPKCTIPPPTFSEERRDFSSWLQSYHVALPPPHLGFLLSFPPDWKGEGGEAQHIPGKPSVCLENSAEHRHKPALNEPKTWERPHQLIGHQSGFGSTSQLCSQKSIFALIPFPNWDTWASLIFTQRWVINTPLWNITLQGSQWTQTIKPSNDNVWAAFLNIPRRRQISARQEEPPVLSGLWGSDLMHRRQPPGGKTARQNIKSESPPIKQVDLCSCFSGALSSSSNCALMSGKSAVSMIKWHCVQSTPKKQTRRERFHLQCARLLNFRQCVHGKERLFKEVRSWVILANKFNASEGCEILVNLLCSKSSPVCLPHTQTDDLMQQACSVN